MLNYKDMSIEDIMQWCVENNQVAWLKAIASQKVECKVYPTMKVAKLDEAGNPVCNKKGKPLYKAVADKSKEPTIELRPITFVQIKTAFVEKFMPEIAPKKTKKETMFDKIAAL